MAARDLGNRARYDAMARGYAALVGLGGFERFHRAVASALDDAPGATFLDLGCGPGGLVPHLREKVGPAGRVIGVDLSDEMIRRARRLASDAGWRNVSFERADALAYSPGCRVRAAIFCLSLSTFGEPERCLEHVTAMLEPGGQLVILDSIPEPSRPIARWVMRLKAPLVGARPTSVPLEFVSARLEDVRFRRFYGGVYALLSARKPAAH